MNENQRTPGGGGLTAPPERADEATGPAGGDPGSWSPALSGRHDNSVAAGGTAGGSRSRAGATVGAIAPGGAPAVERPAGQAPAGPDGVGSSGERDAGGRPAGNAAVDPALGTVHVIGGGLAGLSAALELAEAGRRVALYESGPACGGRARSYEDRQLGCRIDNGNHLLLSANEATFRFLDRIGARDTLMGPGVPLFPFANLADGARWSLDLSHGRVPWWLLRRDRRVPGMRLREVGGLLRLMRARRSETVAECLAGSGLLAERLMLPLAISVLNTRPEQGSAALLGAVMRESLAKGGAACVPWFPREGLSETFIDPAVARLRALGAIIRTGARVGGMELLHGRVGALMLPEGRLPLGPRDQVVLAVPAQSAPAVASGVLELRAPDEFESILNFHYRSDAGDFLRGDLHRARFVGLVGGIAEWVFVKPGILSVTVSAANHLSEHDNAELAERVWGEVRVAVRPYLRPGAPEEGLLPVPLPPHRVVREKRATFAATPWQEGLRPPGRTSLPNLVLAGDWTATGLPATIEGAMRSGSAAAALLLPTVGRSKRDRTRNESRRRSDRR
ncbi:hydroxysqualene dehydroxylase HpnE [Rhizosaccharibacter radicis]|uniref:Hydroxysqualene dehydroxylase HpnE n=1 Tax=Rhizosaccharibacter radicis TaxID=2782605 RepID=A0ABT1W0D9_9PROT|nr:hydroxysqualene dehydroxylase HpnE [Acetobacteraceae bacterium KSS12]